MKKLLLIVLLPLLTGCNEFRRLTGTHDTPAPQAQAVGQKTLFVLMGQSNMVGYGSGTSPIAQDPHITAYDGKWELGHEPLFHNLESGALNGPGMSFATEYLKTHPSESVGLVLCAEGGSYLEDWRPGHRLYIRCARFIEEAKKTGRVAGYLWMQGESDAQWSLTPDPAIVLHANDYASVLGSMEQNLMEDVGASASWTHAVIGHKPSFGGTRFNNWPLIQDQIRSMPNHFETEDLISDLHFNTDGYVEIGRRFAAGK